MYNKGDSSKHSVPSPKENYLTNICCSSIFVPPKIYLLLGQSQSDSENQEEQDTESSKPEPVQKKKVKRKKKNTGQKGKKSGMSSEDNDLAVLEKYIQKKGVSCTPEKSVESSSENLLTIDLKHLNYEYEMRRTFGKQVVKLENKRGRSKPTLKTTYICTPKANRPKVPKDFITMRVLGKDDDIPATKDTSLVWFTFEHSKAYKTAQETFLGLVHTEDADSLVNLLWRNPYHIDTLIQLNEYCKTAENLPMAADLIERAVLGLETSLHPSFSFTSGKCRLDYRRQENRPFFISLFKHAQNLESKACCRTAFEISKVIFNLNVETDPLAMILIIDYYAIRAKMFSWLEKFYDQWQEAKNLAQLPNMAFSYSLALFYKNEIEKADEALQYALLMFPGALQPLLEVLSVPVDSQISSNKYFEANVCGSLSPSLHQLIALYVCRAKVIWKDNNVIKWLEKNIAKVLERIQNKDPLIIEYNYKREQRYVNPPRAILRHVFLCDLKEQVPLARFLIKEKNPTMAYDPLPPADSIDIYKFTTLTNITPSNPTGRGTNLGRILANLAPTFTNFRTLERTDDIAEQVANVEREIHRQFEAIEHQEQVPGNSNDQYNDFRQSVSGIVDAMRDFFASMRMTDTSQNDDDNNGTSGDEEDSTDYDEAIIE